MQEGFKVLRLLFGCSIPIEVVSAECLLRILMPQDHLVLLQVLDLRILGNALLVVTVVLLNCLRPTASTCGMKGGAILRCYSFSHYIFLKKGCCFTSSTPPLPSLASGRRWISRLMKSTLSRLHP